jgi:Ser/Thr protein kinase RdoA (MazF antagonist)
MPKKKQTSSAAPYDALTPECLLDAVDATGLKTDGRLQGLNSFENRVYQVWAEGHAGGRSVVVKFYRPRRGGRTPELEDQETLRWLGRLIARIHVVGEQDGFRARPAISIREFGEAPVQYVLGHDFVPDDLRIAYETTALDVLERVRACWDAAGPYRTLRLHGDCHAGNMLWTDAGPHFVDLDDARMGPAVQDLWMCLSGGRQDQQLQLRHLLKGYREFRAFNPDELRLIESLRTLRILHYSGWLAQRWQDPAFVQAFPFFNTQRYWQDHILSLREQAAALEEEPLELDY